MLICITGLPGSGKSTFGQSYFGADRHPRARVPLFETDEYFYKPDLAKPGGTRYVFDPTMLSVYHQANQERTRRWLAQHSGSFCVVANTFSQHWELEPYVKIAAETRHQIKVYYCDPDPLTLEDLARDNLHGVPLETIVRMDQRWERVKAAMTVFPYRTMSTVR